MIEKEVELLRNFNSTEQKDIENLILELGLNNESIFEQPRELSQHFGKGLRIWQYPNQLAKFAQVLMNIKVDSYMEIGCRYGGTFIFVTELLAKNNPNLKSYACDIMPEYETLKHYRNHFNFTYLHMNSFSQDFKNMCNTIKPEFAFIDGDHGYAGVKNDYQIFENLEETKYLVFHDITNDTCPDVARVWKEVKDTNRFDMLEFTDQYDSVRGTFLGIGLAIRK